ncbi:MAG: carboxymuconolactone decarboxylase family protein [Candidatus Heimdallarchaeota archaeon]|nr:carboxymuconolactone decarboxylase family protein [Candidatus Heimdallarchaeota archaeon]
MNIPNKDRRISQSNRIGDEMYGSNWKAIIDGIDSIDPTFAEFLQEIPYGSVYPREGLDIKKREIAAISVLTQLNLKPQLKSHILAGLKVGLTKQEILELILHISMFIGFPLALDALKVAHEVFKEKNV